MSSAAAGSSRTEERLRAYRRTLYRSFLVCVGLHLGAIVAINPDAILRYFRPKVLIGFPGADQPGDLAPQGEPRAPNVSLPAVHGYMAPVSLIRMEVVSGTGAGEVTPAAQPSRGAVVATRAIEPSEPEGGGAPRGRPGGIVHFELTESWAVVPGSGEVARSENFQTLKIVRPQYPAGAIQKGQEGLVKLEASVDSVGRVVGVVTRENDTASAELEQAAVDAMYRWEFKPYLLNARPIPFTVVVPFRYRLVE